MTEQEKSLWAEFREKDGQAITPEELKLIGRLHAKYYNHSYEIPCTCNSRAVKRYIDDINKVYIGG